MKSWSLNFLELSGSVQACSGTHLPFFYCTCFGHSTVHHQEYLSTVYTAIGICHASSVGCLLADSQQNYNEKYLYRVNSAEILLMMDSGHVRNMCSVLSNKFEKWCISLASVIRIYDDAARPSECQRLFYLCYFSLLFTYISGIAQWTSELLSVKLSIMLSKRRIHKLSVKHGNCPPVTCSNFHVRLLIVCEHCEALASKFGENATSV